MLSHLFIQIFLVWQADRAVVQAAGFLTGES